MKNSLIIGIDGQIGSALSKIIDDNILATTIFPEFVSNNCKLLDLSKDISVWEAPSNISTAYICAAICSIKDCAENSEKAFTVNVKNTIKLAKKLVNSGAFVVFPSTNMVFDGAKPNYKETDKVCPVTEYGLQKVETEIELLKMGNCAIIRFSKIIGSNLPLIKKWIKDLKNNISIHPFSDMKMSPVSLNFAAKVMRKIGESKSSGIWHVSNNEEITYEEAARHIVKKLNLSENLIKPAKAKDKGITNIPDYSTLDTQKLNASFDLISPDAFAIIDSQFNL